METVHDAVIDPPKKLQDGRAYQFKYTKSIIEGYYGANMNRFYYLGGFICADNCTDIKKLTVEVK